MAGELPAQWVLILAFCWAVTSLIEKCHGKETLCCLAFGIVHADFKPMFGWQHFSQTLGIPCGACHVMSCHDLCCLMQHWLYVLIVYFFCGMFHEVSLVLVRARVS